MPSSHSSQSSSSETSDQSAHERRDSIGSVSLSKDLESINKLLSFLKTFSPEKKKGAKTRKGNAGSSDNEVNKKVIQILDAIYNMTAKLVARVENIEESSACLGNQMGMPGEFVSDAVTNKTYSGALVNNLAAVPNNAHKSVSNEVSPQLVTITGRLDALEQDSLVNVMVCQGEAVNSLIERVKRTNATPKEQAARVREAVINEFNSIANTPVHNDNLCDISILGKDRKHLKIVCSSKHVKLNLIQSVKQVRPPNFYVGDYLTKVRSNLFYRVRSLRKNNDSITSVYTMSGNIYCKIVGDGRPIQINCDRDITLVEERLLSGTGTDSGGTSVAAADVKD
jgi:hypothetical protein